MNKTRCPHCHRLRPGYGYRSEEIRELRDKTQVPYMTLYMVMTQIHQISQAGFSFHQVFRILQAIHPQTMANLALTSDLKLKPRDPKVIWERNHGWKKRR